MGRKLAREKAMQALFQIEVAKIDVDKAIGNVLEESEMDDAGKAYVFKLVKGTYENIDKIDALIRAKALKWELERIGNVEKAVLRLAVYEVIFEEEVPAAVAINEAINMVKMFSTKNGVPFVNAILDKIAKENSG